MKYRLKFKSYSNPDNEGYFVRKLKVGFKACPLLYPDMARTMNKKALDDVMQFMKDQGELEYYEFEIEGVTK
jgi:hypothetical protein